MPSASAAPRLPTGPAWLETDVEWVPYISGWAADDDPAEVVRAAAEAIDELARLVEDALPPREGEEAAA